MNYTGSHPSQFHQIAIAYLHPNRISFSSLYSIPSLSLIGPSQPRIGPQFSFSLLSYSFHDFSRFSPSFSRFFWFLQSFPTWLPLRSQLHRSSFHRSFPGFHKISRSFKVFPQLVPGFPEMVAPSFSASSQFLSSQAPKPKSFENLIIYILHIYNVDKEVLD